MIQEYVNGFMINWLTQQALMIEKQRPAFQKGKWNGIGGKVEANESLLDAMVREFREETGVTTEAQSWQRTLVLSGPDFAVHFFRSHVSEFPAYRQTTDEPLGVFHVNSLISIGPASLPVLDNARWIIPFQFFTGDLAYPVFIDIKRRDEAHS